MVVLHSVAQSLHQQQAGASRHQLVNELNEPGLSVYRLSIYDSVVTNIQN